MDSNDKVNRRNIDLFLIALVVLLILGVSFELYGHYAYIHGTGEVIIRVDRVTGEVCTMPCNAESPRNVVFAQPEPSPSEAAKTCHSADVVRVAGEMRIPTNRKPISYHDGGFSSDSPVVRNWGRHLVPHASELSDGHIYSFSSSSFVAVNTWSTGQDVKVCATWSKIENRPFYSVGSSEDSEPASIAI